jgi:hypothetical protein
MDVERKPSAENLAKAHAHLQAKYMELIREADDAYARGPKAVQEIISPDWHFVAARAMKKTEAECPWMKNTEVPAARDECPGCGEIYKVGILRHSCGWFFNREAWEKNQGAAKV